MPDVKVRVVKRYKVDGDRKWYPTLHGALLRHAYNLIKKRCPQTSNGQLCDPEEHPRCRWHAWTGNYSKRVALRLVRMWRSKMSTTTPSPANGSAVGLRDETER